MRRDYRDYLEDMLTAIDEVAEFTEGKSPLQWKTDHNPLLIKHFLIESRRRKLLRRQLQQMN